MVPSESSTGLKPPQNVREKHYPFFRICFFLAEDILSTLHQLKHSLSIDS